MTKDELVNSLQKRDPLLANGDTEMHEPPDSKANTATP